MTTIPIPRSPKYEENEDGPKGPKGGQQPCIVCGLACPTPQFFVHVVDGGGSLMDSPEPTNDGGDLGLYPIGSGCLKRYPELRDYASDAW
jgi:hypothetical protein